MTFERPTGLFPDTRPVASPKLERPARAVALTARLKAGAGNYAPAPQSLKTLSYSLATDLRL
jgi:hypothetical protein